MAGNKDFSQMSVEEMVHYMRIGTKKEEMFHALRSGSGMKGILNTAYTCLGNPLTVCDTSFSILENCPAHANDMDFEIRNHKQYMKTEAVLSMHREKLVERIFSETEPFTYFRDALGIDMMYCQIAIKKSVVGYVCVLAKNRAFIADDYEIVAALAQMLSVEMQKSSFFTEKAGFKYEYFLTDLIEGNMSDPAFIKQRMIQLGRKPLKNYWLFAVMFEQEKGIHISHQYYLEQLLTIVKNSTALFYKGHIVMLVSADENQPYGGEEAV